MEERGWRNAPRALLDVVQKHDRGLPTRGAPISACAGETALRPPQPVTVRVRRWTASAPTEAEMSLPIAHSLLRRPVERPGRVVSSLLAVSHLPLPLRHVPLPPPPPQCDVDVRLPYQGKRELSMLTGTIIVERGHGIMAGSYNWRVRWRG